MCREYSTVVLNVKAEAWGGGRAWAKIQRGSRRVGPAETMHFPPKGEVTHLPGEDLHPGLPDLVFEPQGDL
jgi:hypothetical protein